MTDIDPKSILGNWDIPGINLDKVELHEQTHGLVNKVFLFHVGKNDSDLYVLQFVHPAVSMDGAMHNYLNVTEYLKGLGMAAQSLVKTKSDCIWVEDSELTGWRWRLLRGVKGKIFNQTNDPELAYEAGRKLAEFHLAMTKYPKPLEDGRKSFRYENEISKLKKYKDQLLSDEDPAVREATELILNALPKLALPSDLPLRIIHADPKISNFVFNENKEAICMIDLDTIQKLSPLYDLGDALRSWCGKKEDDPANSFNLEIANAFLEGYRLQATGYLSEREYRLIPQAVTYIILGLATRFLNDYVEDSYFGWDETKYKSRKAHNKARALSQVALYNSIISISTTVAGVEKNT